MITLFNLLISNRHWQTLALLNFFPPLNTGSEFWKFGLFFEFFKHKYYSSAGLSKHSRPLLLYREALHNISLGRILSPSAPNGFKKKTMLLPYPPSVAETTNALMRIYLFFFLFMNIHQQDGAGEKRMFKRCHTSGSPVKFFFCFYCFRAFNGLLEGVFMDVKTIYTTFLGKKKKNVRETSDPAGSPSNVIDRWKLERKRMDRAIQRPNFFFCSDLNFFFFF